MNFDFLYKDTREKNEAFGSSLLLANSPMSPKIVNGSFAAICNTDEFMAKDYAGIRMAAVSVLVVFVILTVLIFWFVFRVKTHQQCGDVLEVS